MKIQNIHNKLIGFGTVEVLPGAIATVPDKYAINGVIDLYKKRKMVTVLESPKPVDSKEEEIPQFTVSFYDPDSTLFAEIQVALGEDVEIPLYTPPEGYELTGWTTTKSGTKKVNFTNVKANMKAYARIEAAAVEDVGTDDTGSDQSDNAESLDGLDP